MTASTLQMLGFSVLGGSCIFCICIFLFGIAVYQQHIFIAPRATARPKDVIYNRSYRSSTNRTGGIVTTTSAKKEKDHNKQQKCHDDDNVPYLGNSGNPFTGWIHWTLSLTYETMLQGVPGTGTRNFGLQGSMLKVKLDGIVLLRFHAFALRISALATILYLIILLPVYFTAQCHPDYRTFIGTNNNNNHNLNNTYTNNSYTNTTNIIINNNNDDDIDSIRDSFTFRETTNITYKCQVDAFNLTNYQQLTMANIPQLRYYGVRSTIATIDNGGVIVRLYLVVFLFYIVLFYSFHQLKHEWIQILAMRRVYYLEYDIYGERKKEYDEQQQQQQNQQQQNNSKRNRLFSESTHSYMYESPKKQLSRKEQKQLAFQQQQQQQQRTTMNSIESEHRKRSRIMQQQQQATTTNNNQNQNNQENGEYNETSNSNSHKEDSTALLSNHNNVSNSNRSSIHPEPHLTNRDPWIPHPELRETIPNVALYSVLVGGLPSLPKHNIGLGYTDETIILSKRERVDWQLGLTTAFFDHCVPNQPGYTSSVAAVTIIPGAKDMANAWKKWSNAVAYLRRLRYLRQQIKRKKQQRELFLLSKSTEQQQQQQQLQLQQQNVSSMENNHLVQQQQPTHLDRIDDDNNDADADNDVVYVPESIADEYHFENEYYYRSSLLNSRNASTQAVVNQMTTTTPTASANHHNINNDTNRMNQNHYNDKVSSTMNHTMSQLSVFDLESGLTNKMSTSHETLTEFEQPTHHSMRQHHQKQHISKMNQHYMNNITSTAANHTGVVNEGSNEDLDECDWLSNPDIHENKNDGKNINDNTTMSGRGINGGMEQMNVPGVVSPTTTNTVLPLYETVTFGPEQSAVYSREFAQSAAGCSPNGFCYETLIENLTLEQLIDLEMIAEKETQIAYDELRTARDKAAIFSDFLNKDHHNNHHNKHHQQQHDSNDSCHSITSKDPRTTESINEVCEINHTEREILSKVDANNLNNEEHHEVSQSTSASVRKNHDDNRPTLNNSTKHTFHDTSYYDLPPDPPSPPLPSLHSETKSRHGRKPSFENVRMPSTFHLEAELYRKSTWDGKAILPHHQQQTTQPHSPSTTTTNNNSHRQVGGTRSSRKNHGDSASQSPLKSKPIVSDTTRYLPRSATLPSPVSFDDMEHRSNTTAGTSTNTIHQEGNINHRRERPDQITKSRSHPEERQLPSSDYDSHNKVVHPPISDATSMTIETQQLLPPSTSEYSEPLSRILNIDESNITTRSKSKKTSMKTISKVTPPTDVSQDPSLPRADNTRQRSLTFHASVPNYEPNTASQRNRFLSVDEAASKRGLLSATIPEDKKNDTKDPVKLPETDSRWAQVETIIEDALQSERPRSRSFASSTISTGVWSVPSIQGIFKVSRQTLRQWMSTQANKAADHLARDSTYAVVTFTSRQAAIAARACVADGRGHQRWMTLNSLPVPPLADAPAWDFSICRNCCRPVTLSINEQQKTCRHYFAMTLLAFIYVFYTVPLTSASRFLEPEKLDELFPNADNLDNIDFTGLMSGLVTAGLWSSFFALCPLMFMGIANFGSRATSVAAAEYDALRYYWWFMVLTAFSGQTLANMGLKGLEQGVNSDRTLKTVLREIGLAVPTVVSLSWLNWIIFRVLIVLPLNYLLQINTYIFHFLGFKCFSRVARGGGPGAPMPYRIYIDSGVVLLCVFALAPFSPLIAPAGYLYFLFCQPLLRRNLIFVNRPKYDGGGHRWPFIFNMCISAMIVAEILLTTQMALKQASGPAFVACISILPTLIFSGEMNKRYHSSFKDAALCQTSMLDGWYDDEGEFTFEKREEFRQFLVDAHKASYVPVCLASPDTEFFLTAEPAVVIPLESELIQDPPPYADVSDNQDPDAPISNRFESQSRSDNVAGKNVYQNVPSSPAKSMVFADWERRGKLQHGASLRRNSLASITTRYRRSGSSGIECVYRNSTTSDALYHSSGVDEDWTGGNYGKTQLDGNVTAKID